MLSLLLICTEKYLTNNDLFYEIKKDYGEVLIQKLRFSQILVADVNFIWW